MAIITANQSRLVAWLDNSLTLPGSIFDAAGHTVYGFNNTNGASVSWKAGRALNSLPSNQIVRLGVYRVQAGNASLNLGNRVAGAGGTVDLSAIVGGSPNPSPNPPSGSQLIGINLSPMKDWDGGVTVNRFDHAREPVSVYNNVYGSFPPGFTSLPKDANGYVTSLQPNQQYQSPIIIENGKTEVPTGTWVFLWEGDRQNSNVSLRGQTLTYSTPIGATSHRATFTYNGTSDIWLDVAQVATNYPKNFKLIYPGYENNQQAFNNPFLKRMTFRYARVMDWQNTNIEGTDTGNRTTTWAERATLNTYSQATKTGISLELILRLCNQLNINPYLCIPGFAIDQTDYITNFLTFVRDNLDPELMCYVELGNEMWNFQFTQTQNLAVLAQNAGLQPTTGTNSWDYAWAGQGFYTANLTKIADTVFAGQRSRIKTCLSGQAGSGGADQAKRALRFIHPTYNTACGNLIQCLNLAPYFSGSINRAENYDTTRQMTNAQMFQAMYNSIDGDVTTMINNHKTFLASEFPSVEINLYEMGQHLTPGQAASGRPQADFDWIAARFGELNSDPEMYNVYIHYFTTLRNLLPNAVFFHFSDTSRDSQFGYWGSQKSYLTPLSQSPKRRALHFLNGDNLTDLETTSW